MDSMVWESRREWEEVAAFEGLHSQPYISRPFQSKPLNTSIKARILASRAVSTTVHYRGVRGTVTTSDERRGRGWLRRVLLAADLRGGTTQIDRAHLAGTMDLNIVDFSYHQFIMLPCMSTVINHRYITT